MKSTLIAITLASTLSFSAFAADSYTVDSRHTFPSFEINHLGFSLQRGRFNNTSGKVTLDNAAKSGSIDVTIDAASISTGLADLEKHLKTEDFFDVEKYPAITFKSRKLKFEGDKLVSAEGDFTLHGITKPVTLKIDHFFCGVHPMNKQINCGANATATIKRTEYGISKYAPLLGDEVKISIQVEATKD